MLHTYILIITCFLHLVGHFQEPTPTDDSKATSGFNDKLPGRYWERNNYHHDGTPKRIQPVFFVTLPMDGGLEPVSRETVREPTQLLCVRLPLLTPWHLSVGTGISLIYFFFIPTTCFVLALIFFVLAAIQIK